MSCLAEWKVPMTRIAVAGGAYSNPYAFRSFLADAHYRGADRILFLGDLVGYGAEPNAIWPLIKENDVECIAGNYDVAIGRGDLECGCGYLDPTDNLFAQAMYDYTREHTSTEFAAWMTTLPTEKREVIDGCELHAVHGSPLALNDFWWESLPEYQHNSRITASGAEIILCTHSGLPWARRFGPTLVVNVGVVGRPANDGTNDVWYAMIDIDEGYADASLIPLSYNWRAHADAMRRAHLPEPFINTVETGWWTACLEVLPPKERSYGRYQLYRSSLDPSQTKEDPVESTVLPVLPLFGSPLFPDTLWLELEPRGILESFDGRGHNRQLLHDAFQQGFRSVVIRCQYAPSRSIEQLCVDSAALMDTTLEVPVIDSLMESGLQDHRVTVNHHPPQKQAVASEAQPIRLTLTNDHACTNPDTPHFPTDQHPILSSLPELPALAELKRRAIELFLTTREADGTMSRATQCAI